MLAFFYTAGGASLVRGYQIAHYLNAKHNPQSGYEDDTCVFIKRIYRDYNPKMSYLDIHDDPRAIAFAKNHPDLGILTDTRLGHDYIASVLNRSDIKMIPHHHCNYERHIRPPREVKVVGIIGGKSAFQYPIDKIRKRLADIDLELRYDENYWPLYDNKPNERGKDGREKVCNFYKEIDIQIVWRTQPWMSGAKLLGRPLKLINASSFGIPTIAYPEPSYVDEWDKCFLQAKTIDSLLEQANELKKSSSFYEMVSYAALQRAEGYHIEHIAPLYLKL